MSSISSFFKFLISLSWPKNPFIYALVFGIAFSNLVLADVSYRKVSIKTYNSKTKINCYETNSGLQVGGLIDGKVMIGKDFQESLKMQLKKAKGLKKLKVSHQITTVSSNAKVCKDIKNTPQLLVPDFTITEFDSQTLQVVPSIICSNCTSVKLQIIKTPSFGVVNLNSSLKFEYKGLTDTFSFVVHGFLNKRESISREIKVALNISEKLTPTTIPLFKDDVSPRLMPTLTPIILATSAPTQISSPSPTMTPLILNTLAPTQTSSPSPTMTPIIFATDTPTKTPSPTPTATNTPRSKIVQETIFDIPNSYSPPSESSVLSTLKIGLPRLKNYSLIQDVIAKAQYGDENAAKIVNYMRDIFERPSGSVLANPIPIHPNPDVNTDRLNLPAPTSAFCAMYYSGIYDVQNMTVIGAQSINTDGTVATGNRNYSGAQFKAALLARAKLILATYSNSSLWPNWGPDHSSEFLDTGPILQEIAYLYDCFSPLMSLSEKAAVVSAIKRNALTAIYQNIKGPQSSRYWWSHSSMNQNPVAHRALIAAAISILNDDPDPQKTFEKTIIIDSISSIEYFLKTLGVDGGDNEGLNYLSMTQDGLVGIVEELESAFDTDFGVSTYPGFADSFIFPIYMSGSNKLQWDFSSSRLNGEDFDSDVLNPTPQWTYGLLSWAANRWNKPVLSRIENEMFPRYPQIRHYFSYSDLYSEQSSNNLPLDRVFHANESFSMRTGWEREAMFVAGKGGSSYAGQGHFNKDFTGDFVTDFGGERFVTSLGIHSYNLPNEMPASLCQNPGIITNGNVSICNGDAVNWGFYRENGNGKNLTLINGKDLYVRYKGYPTNNFYSYPHASIEKFEKSQELSISILNTSIAYDPNVNNDNFNDVYVSSGTGIIPRDVLSAKRGFAMERPIINGVQRQRLFIQDEFKLSANLPVDWHIHTTAAVSGSGKTLVLTQNEMKQGERQITLRLLSPSNGSFVVESIPSNPQSSLSIASILYPQWYQTLNVNTLSQCNARCNSLIDCSNVTSVPLVCDLPVPNGLKKISVRGSFGINPKIIVSFTPLADERVLPTVNSMKVLSDWSVDGVY